MSHWLNVQFWHTILQQTMSWLVTTIPALFVILLLAFVSLKLINVAIRRLRNIMLRYQLRGRGQDAEAQKRIDTLTGIIAKVLIISVWCMLIMVFLRRLGIDIAPLIAGAGVAGLAMGFGAQELVRDVIAGFFILLDNQVRVGDAATINGTSGLVEKIDLRTIVLRDLTGTVHIFQNGKINSLSNMTKEWSAAVFDIGVAYKENIDRVIEVMKETADELRADPAYKERILEPLEVFGVDNFADSAVVMKARIKTLPGAQWTVGREYRRRLKKAFDGAGIEIPFPHRTLVWNEGKTAIEPKERKHG